MQSHPILFCPPNNFHFLRIQFVFLHFSCLSLNFYVIFLSSPLFIRLRFIYFLYFFISFFAYRCQVAVGHHTSHAVSEACNVANRQPCSASASSFRAIPNFFINVIVFCYIWKKQSFFQPKHFRKEHRLPPVFCFRFSWLTPRNVKNVKAKIKNRTLHFTVLSITMILGMAVLP